MKNLWKKIGVEECPKTKIMDINLQENMPEIPQIQKISRQ